MSEQPVIDRVFQALSDGTRRAILRRLAEAPATVSDLAKPFPMSLAAVSKHIGILVDSGLVVKVREGRTVTCRIVLQPLEEADRTIRELHTFWNDRVDELDAYLRSRNVSARGGGAKPSDTPTEGRGGSNRKGESSE